MIININKTKGMVIKRSKNVPRPVQIDRQVLKLVDWFQYLGCWMNCKFGPAMELRSRIEQARNCFLLQAPLRFSIRLGLRLIFPKYYVCSTLLYGAKIWTLNQAPLMNWKLSRCGHIVEYSKHHGRLKQQTKKSCAS